MKRFTQKLEDKNIVLLNELSIKGDYVYGEAIDRLAKFESFYDEITKAQLEISSQLEALRNEGKDKTVEFKELFTKKLVNNNVMAFLRFHGLADKK